MPRLRRNIQPGSLVHVISRFHNREFRLREDEERAEYLARLGYAVLQSDWRLLGYSLMSSHIHLAFIAGVADFWTVIKSVHCGFANWLNRAQRRLGSVFADRPKTFIIDPLIWSQLVAYIHNNPVSAGIINSASETIWSSHRAYIGAVARPAWLNVSLGLQLLGFSDSPPGQQAFNKLVIELASEPRSNLFNGSTIAADRRQLRRELKAAISCSYPKVYQDRLEYQILCPAEPWSGNIDQVLEEACNSLKISVSMIRGRVCEPELRNARLLAVLAARCLGFSLEAIGLSLGISHTAVARIIRRRSPAIIKQAREIASRMRTGGREERSA